MNAGTVDIPMHRVNALGIHMSTRIVHADHVVLGDVPPIDDGAVVVDGEGTIVDVGKATDIRPRHAGADIEQVQGVIFPGLVNAHTHIELSAMRGKVSGGHGFVAWVDRLVAIRTEISAEESEEAIGDAARELKTCATVAVGDVTNTLSPTHALARQGIGGCLFHEVFGVDRAVVLKRIEGLREEVEEQARSWPTDDLTYAPAPHTLFTLHEDAAKALLDSAAKRNLRTSLHLAEHPAERRVVENGDGPIAKWFEERLKQKPTFPMRPLFDVAEAVGALRPGVILVHLAEARREELDRVAKSGASVVLCPRSNLFIENRLPPFLAVREAGIEAALGTDSLASNTSLDVLAEAKALRDRFPSVPSWELLKMATWNGARALGREADLGRFVKGARPGVYCVDGPGHLSGAMGDPCAFLLLNLKAQRRMLIPRAPGKRPHTT
jgi:aminodeoxyfutalosine deaminase